MSELSEPENELRTVRVRLEYLDALRKAIGLHINPDTAEVYWTYAKTIDPYDDDPNLRGEYQQIGREYFARSPGSDLWIWFGDLPEATRDILWEKHRSKLAFPAGFEFMPDPDETDRQLRSMIALARHVAPELADELEHEVQSLKERCNASNAPEGS
jgi:hypothetical protein